MTRSFFTRAAILALGTALAVVGLEPPSHADANPPVVLIVMENHGFGPTDLHVNGDTRKYIVGNTADAPYINNTLIPSGTLLTNHYSNFHPSLPDYLELTGGTNAGCIVDSCARDALPNENLFHLLGEAGASFASLDESMPANCTLANTGTYLVRHNPETYYTNVDAASGLPYSCPNTDLAMAPVTPGTPLAWPNPLPAFSFITPDSCHDMHGSTAAGPCPSGTDQIITDGDTWLSANVPALLSEGALVIVTFDEGASGDSTHGGGHIATVMAGPNVGVGTTDATLYSHASLLAGLEDYFGLTPLLADAASATPLPIPKATPYPTPIISGLTPETGSAGDPVTITGTGLTNAYAVRFAGTPATFSVDSDASITATVPVGATTGPVTVSTVGGTATSPDTFTVVPVGPSPPALVQHVIGSGTKATQASVTWPQSTVAGDLQVATIGWSGSAKVTPPAGWVLAVSSGGTAIYYRQNAPVVSGAISFSMSVKANWVLSVSEWSGIATSAAFDKKAQATSGQTSGTTASSGTTPVTAMPVELAIAGIKAMANVTESGPTDGFAQVDQRTAGTNDTFGAFDFVSTTAASRSTSVALSAPSKWRGVIATFRGA
jgi:phosphatidylinositol-3-phosphatase